MEYGRSRVRGFYTLVFHTALGMAVNRDYPEINYSPLYIRKVSPSIAHLSINVASGVGHCEKLVDSCRARSTTPRAFELSDQRYETYDSGGISVIDSSSTYKEPT